MTKMRLLLVQNFTVTTQLSLLLKKSLVESQKARLTFNLSLRNRRNCFCLCEQNAELILLALKARATTKRFLPILRTALQLLC